MSVDTAKGRRLTLLSLAAVFALTLLAYSNSFRSEFQFDDYHQVVKNSRIRDIANVPRFFIDAHLGSYDLDIAGYRPVTYASFALSYALGGNGVAGFHAFNLGLHVLNAFLVFFIVRLVGRDEKGVHGGAGLAPLLSALVFALHPVQTNAVSYVSGRAVLLASAFSLGAFYFFVSHRKTGSVAAAIFAPILFLLGLLSKEMAVGTLGLMAAYDLFLPSRKGAGFARRAAGYAPFIAALAVYLIARRQLTGFTVASPAYTTGVYLLSEAKALLVYLRLLVLPFNQNFDYNLPPARTLDAGVLLGAAVLAALVFLVARFRRNSPAAAFFGAWFLLALAPESSLFPITDVVEEYRLYLPSIGFVAALVTLAASRPWPWPKLARAAAGLVIAMLFALTLARNGAWATERSLWQDTIAKSPGSPRAHSYLAKTLYKDGKYEDAIRELKRALELDPSYNGIDDVYSNLGASYEALGRHGEAAGYFEAAIRISPGLVEAYSGLGDSLYEMGRYEEAAAAFRRGVIINPSYAPLRMELGRAYRRLGRLPEALAEMKQAASLAPRDFGARFYLALMYLENGLRPEALAEAEAALSLAGSGQEADDARDVIRRFEGR